MRARRSPWVLAACLLLAGALAGAGEVRQHWLPCRGSMLSGSVLRGFAYGPDFSDSCLDAMDRGFGFVGPSSVGRWSVEPVLGIVTVLLLTLAWTTVVVSSAWSPTTRRLALLPAGANLALLALTVGGLAAALGPLTSALLFAPNVLAVVALVVIGVREEPGAAVMLRVGLVLAASTAVSLVPTIADYVLMGWFSDADWDMPPGSGYPTVAMVALAAVVLLVLVRAPARADAPGATATVRA